MRCCIAFRVHDPDLITPGELLENTINTGLGKPEIFFGKVQANQRILIVFGFPHSSMYKRMRPRIIEYKEALVICRNYLQILRSAFK